MKAYGQSLEEKQQRKKQSDNAIDFHSKPFNVNGFYESMQGPVQIFNVPLKIEKPAVVTEFGVLMKKNGEVTNSDHLCHVNAAVIPDDVEKMNLLRLLTLSQGQSELRFPEGFGMQVFPGDVLRIESQVLNYASPFPFRLDKQFQLSFSYNPNVVGLLVKSAVVRQPTHLSDPKTGNMVSCLPEKGHLAKGSITKNQGLSMTSHWMIPPGEFRATTEVTKELSIDNPILVHVALAHVHPYAKSISLHETGRSEELIRIFVKNYSHKKGVEKIELFRSKKGVLLQPSKRYSLTTVYNNTTQKQIDVMAGMNLFYQKVSP